MDGVLALVFLSFGFYLGARLTWAKAYQAGRDSYASELHSLRDGFENVPD